MIKIIVSNVFRYSPGGSVTFLHAILVPVILEYMMDEMVIPKLTVSLCTNEGGGGGLP